MLETDVNLQKRNFEHLSDAKRYYGWFADLVMPYVGKSMLEIGCGQGNITEQFIERGVTVHGIDLEDTYLPSVQERFKKKDFSVELADIMDENVRKRLKAQKFDTILCFNVIEHIEDDRALARYMEEIVEPGGSVIVLAPAHDFLMSKYDLLVGHYRRYTKKSLTETLQSGGLKIRFATYFNAVGAVGWLVIFKWLGRIELRTGSVGLLETLTPVLKKVERSVPIPFGLSAIVIGTKADNA
jgi:SAM-dependent methyltransferase